MGAKSSKQSSKDKYTDQELNYIKANDVDDLKTAVLRSLSDLPTMDDYKLETQQRLMSGDRDAVGGKKLRLAKANCFKIKISKKKCRYRDRYYDLDLAYITKRIIVMGYPATGLDRIGRNSSGDIISFLRRYHRDHAKVINLCQEPKRVYNPSLFTDRGFETANFPFWDHSPCNPRVLLEFSIVSYLYMIKDPNNVLVIHCKAGKGRSGLAACAYLLFVGGVKSREEALVFYGSRRTINAKGLTIASQIRYLGYFESILKSNFDSNYPQIALEYIEKPKETLYKYVPRVKKIMRVINIGPVAKDMNISFHLEDLQGRALGYYRTRTQNMNERTFDIEKISTKKDHEHEEGVIHEIILGDSAIFEDDVVIKLNINNISLSTAFNLNYLKTGDSKVVTENITYAPNGKPILYKSRPFDSDEYQKKSKFSYTEFHSYDFDKWYQKEGTSSLSEKFSVIIGFNDI